MIIYIYKYILKFPPKPKGMLHTKFRVFFFQDKEGGKKKTRIRSPSCMADRREFLCLYYIII